MTLRFDISSITPSTGGGGSANIESLSVTPTTSSQTITASGGVDGYSPVNVSAVTAAIDANIVAGNIKKDVSILGVTGTYEGSGGGSKYGATTGTFLGDVDASGVLQHPTEQCDLVFTGVTDVVDDGLSNKFAYSGVKSVSFPDLTTVSGAYGCYYMLSDCSSLTSASFPELTTISGSNACEHMLSDCSSLTSVTFPKLTTISGGNACQFMFSNCTALTSASFPELTTISQSYGCQRLLSGCLSLTSVTFPKLTTISGNFACYSMFFGSTALTDAYFPALTTTSFGTRVNQFNSMMSSTGTSTTHTLHFPSNLEATIQGLGGYPNFGGTSGYVVLTFDLPATS